MASTVPGVARESVAAKLGVGVQTPDLSTLAAPTIPLSRPSGSDQRLAPLRPLDVGKARRIEVAPPLKGGGFAAALAKAIAARKAANDQQASRTTTRQSRLEIGNNENAVRDVVRQLKQLVGAVREALSPKRANGSPIRQAGQAGPDNPRAVAAALNGVFARLVGMNPDNNSSGKSAEGLSLSPQQAEDVAALLQKVADALAQATSADGEIDEASLASALAADPLALAAAQALVSAAQVQQLIAVPVVLTATLTEGDAVTAGEQSANDTTAIAADAPALSTESTGSTPLSSSGVPVDAASPADASFAEAVALAARATSVDATGSSGAEVSAVPRASQPGVLVDAAAIAAAAEAVLSATDTADSAKTAAAASPVDASPPAAEAAPAVAAEAVVQLPAAVDAVAPAADVAAASAATTAAAAAVTDASTSGMTSAANAVAVDAGAVVTAQTDVPQRAPENSTTQSSTARSDGSAVAAATQPVALEAAPVAQATTGTSDSAPAAAAQPALTQVVAAGGVASSGGDLTAASGDGDAGSAAPASVSGSVQTSSAAGSAPSSIASASGAEASQAASVSPAAPTVPPAPTVAAAPAATAPAATSAEAVSSLPLDGSAASVDLHEQVAPVIVREARLVSVGGNHELTVRLEPDHLGPLHVRLSLVEGALSVGLTTATTDAQRALETALPQLRGALVDSGLRLDRLDVSLRDSGNGNQRSGSDSSGRGNDGRPGTGSGGGYQSRQFDGRPDGSPSFADVLFDQDGRVFGPATRGARALGYRAYGRGRSR